MRKRCLETLRRLAANDNRIIFIGSDLTADPQMLKFKEEIGNRFFMEGISEAHLIGMAAGLASTGKIVYVNTIATFLTRRCFEQIAIDVALANCNVRLIGGGGGLVYASLGPTHLAIDDIGLLRLLPNMTIVVPADADEMERAVTASVDHRGPVYLRVAKGGDPIISRAQDPFKIGVPIVLKESNEVMIFANGILVKMALDVADALQKDNLHVGVVNVHTVKPLNRNSLLSLMRKCKLVITLEEHVTSGGLGSAVAEIVAESRFERTPIFKRFGLPDKYPDVYGSQQGLLQHYGITQQVLTDFVKDSLGGVTE